MSLFETEAGKRRLLTVEIPVIERYNDGRAAEYQIKLHRMGTSLVLRYRLKPGHNAYDLETRLVSSYPTVPPETRVLTPLKHCPHLLEGQTLCLSAGKYARQQPLGPFPVYLRVRHTGRVALAGVLRSLARNRRMALARSQVSAPAACALASPRAKPPAAGAPEDHQWLTCSRSARAAAGCRSSTCSAGSRASCA